MGMNIFNWLPVNLLPPITMGLRVLGLVPESPAELCYSVFVSVFMLFNATPTLIHVYLNRNNIAIAIKSLGISLVLFGAFLGHIFILFKTRTLQAIIKETLNDFEECIISREPAVRYLRRSHILLIVLSLIVWCTMTMYTFEPLISQTGELVFPVWYPFRTDDALIYSVAFIYQIICACVAGFLILGGNLIFCELGIHLSEHLEHLCLSVQDAVSPENYPSDVDVEKEMNIRLAWCVKRHNLLLRRVRLLGVSLSTAASVDYVFCIITAAVVALETIVMNENVTFLQQAKSVLLLICAIIEIFPPCLIAQQNLEQQIKVAKTAFSHKLITTPDSVKRTLTIMYLRSQVPTTLMNIFGLIDANLVTYAEALKLAYGIFTLLHHFKG